MNSSVSTAGEKRLDLVVCKWLMNLSHPPYASTLLPFLSVSCGLIIIIIIIIIKNLCTSYKNNIGAIIVS